MTANHLLKGMAIFLCVAFVSCGTATQNEESTKEEIHQVEKAICVLSPTEGNVAEGSVVFTQTAEGVLVTVNISGLTPGKHGFHVHEFGDCSAKDGTSAGGHFNPEGQKHGAPSANERHVGDMGNIVANEEGIAQSEYLDKHIELNGANSIIGHSIIVHKDEDDLSSQPTGNAGARVACGVIGITK